MDQGYWEIIRAEEEADQEDEDLIEEQLIALGLMIWVGAEESRQRRAEQRLAHRTYLVRGNLLPNPRIETPWQKLYQGRDDRAFITTMGFNVISFETILAAGFEALWNSTPIPRLDVSTRAAPRLYRRSLDAAGALGLVLHFLNSTMREVSLQQIFALIPTTVSRYINFSLVILLESLKKIPEASIRWPEGDEFQELNALVVQRHPHLLGAFGTMDGLNLAVQVSIDQELENATYNGWLHDHFVSSVLAFASHGVWGKLPKITAYH